MAIDPEPFVVRYGEGYRRLIVSALKFFEVNVPLWVADGAEDIPIEDYLASVLRDAGCEGVSGEPSRGDLVAPG